MSDGFEPDDGFVPDSSRPGAYDKAMNMIGRGAYALPGLVGLDYETVNAALDAVDVPFVGENKQGSFLDRYRKAKDARLRLSRQTDQDNPITSGVVRGVAAAPAEGLAWLALPEVKLAQGASAVQKALTFGPRLGAMSAATEFGSTAHKDPMDRTIGAALTGAVGSVLGGGMAAALPDASVLVPAVPLADRLRRVANDQGRKTLTGNSAPMSTRKPLSDEAVQAAYDTKAIGPFTSVEKASERLGVTRDALGQQYADIVAALEAKGVTGPNAILLARRLMAEAEQTRVSDPMSAIPGRLKEVGEELPTLVNPKPFASKRLSLTQAENLKRNLQQRARADYVREGPQSPEGEARMTVASRIRSAVEDAIDQQAALAPDEAAAFVPLKQRLGAIIEASTAADRGAARAANRQTFGLGSKVMGAGVLASGNIPGAIAAMVGSKILRDRGPAMVGWSAQKSANALESALARAMGAGRPRQSVTAESEALANFLRSLGEPGLVPVGADEESSR